MKGDSITYVVGKLQGKTDCMCDDCGVPFVYDKEDDRADVIYHQFYTSPYGLMTHYEAMLCEKCGKKAIQIYAGEDYFRVKVISYDEAEPEWKKMIDKSLYKRKPVKTK